MPAEPPGAVGARRAQVVGLGLMGSSLALALRDLGWHVTGTDLNAARSRRAAELHVVDEVGEDDTADLAIVATPVAAIAGVVEQLFQRSRNDGLVVTDLGSVKGPLAAAIAHPRFVGGHPMAGSEQEGPDGADPDLFVGASWVLTPTEQTDPVAFELVRSVVAALGAEVLALVPDGHDALVAMVSHVPHLTAATLMALAADTSVEHAALLRLAAGGFRDMTRIAAGEPTMWLDVFADNAAAVLGVLDELLERLGRAREIVASGDREGLAALLEYAKSARRNLPARVLRPDAVTECRIPVTDRPGELAEVTALFGGLGVNIWDLEIAHSAEGTRGVLVVSIPSEAADEARQALVAKGFRPSMRPLS